MTENLVYIIEHEQVHSLRESGFSQIEKKLRNEGYNLRDLEIEHFMFQYKERTTERDALKLMSINEEIEEYRCFTGIKSKFSTTGTSLGHLKSKNPDEVKRIAKMYIEDEHLNSLYFVITQPELVNEVTEAFENLDFVVQTIERN